MFHGESPQARRYSDIADAATYIGVSDKTIRRMISAGSITAYRFGPRLIRIDLNELDRKLRPIPSARVGGAA